MGASGLSIISKNLSIVVPKISAQFPVGIVAGASGAAAAVFGIMLAALLYNRKKNTKLFDKYQNSLRNEQAMARKVGTPQYDLSTTEQVERVNYKNKKEKKEA